MCCHYAKINKILNYDMFSSGIIKELPNTQVGAPQNI